MFADDTQIATSSDDIKVITETLNRDLINVANWLSANKLTLNNSKTEYMIIGSKKRLSQVTADPAISVGNLEIKRVEMTKSLGLMIDESLDWTAQVEHISKKVTSGLAILRRLRDTVEFNTLTRRPLGVNLGSLDTSGHRPHPKPNHPPTQNPITHPKPPTQPPNQPTLF